ncbi:MAG: DedA family protein [Paludibacteraceae bacterium]|nr:DedA family protein [Paludibacteraceae bacterium]
MEEAGLLGLFIASFLSATILPFSSEAILVGVLYAGFDVLGVIVVATLGNWLGSMSSYALGYVGNWQRIQQWLKISEEKTLKYNSLTQKYGFWLGLIVWVPGIGDIIAVCLGLMRTPILRTSVMIFVGKLFRYAIIAFMTIKMVVQH